MLYLRIQQILYNKPIFLTINSGKKKGARLWEWFGVGCDSVPVILALSFIARRSIQCCSIRLIEVIYYHYTCLASSLTTPVRGIF